MVSRPLGPKWAIPHILKYEIKAKNSTQLDASRTNPWLSIFLSGWGFHWFSRWAWDRGILINGSTRRCLSSRFGLLQKNMEMRDFSDFQYFLWLSIIDWLKFTFSARWHQYPSFRPGWWGKQRNFKSCEWIKNYRETDEKYANILQGDLNADYAVRVSKFLEAYNKTVAPAIANDDSTKEPVFKGYEVKTNLRPYVHFTIIFANIRFVQKFEYKTELGTCGAFPYGYVATDASAEVEKFN